MHFSAYVSEIFARIPGDAWELFDLKGVLWAVLIWILLFWKAHLSNQRFKQARMKRAAMNVLGTTLIACGCVFLFLLFVYSPYRHYQENKNQQNIAQDEIGKLKMKIAKLSVTPTAIYIKCNQLALPLHVDRGQSVHLIPLNKNRLRSVTWGYMDYSNHTDSSQQWPSKHVMKEAKTNPAIWVWQCQVSNYGPTTVLDINIPLSISFDKEPKPFIYDAIIGALATGESFSFYPINDCPGAVTVIWPEKATLQVLGESARKEAPIKRHYRDPIEQIISFPPSTSRFIGGEPCDAG